MPKVQASRRTSSKKKVKKPVKDVVPKIGKNPFAGTFEYIGTLDDEISKITFASDTYDYRGSKCESVIEGLSLALNIKTTDDEVPISDKLLNTRNLGTTKILSIGYYDPLVHVDDDKGDDPFRDVTQEEMDRLVTKREVIAIQKELIYKRVGGWRARDLMSAILDYECRTRAKSDWFGGVDTHHTQLDYAEYGGCHLQFHFGS